jgi:c-di-GMP-binding flagellar brake protein YcgR
MERRWDIMLEFDFSDSHQIKNLDLKNKLVPNDVIKLGLVKDEDNYDCLAKITTVREDGFEFKLIQNFNIPLQLGQEFEVLFMKETGVYKIIVSLEKIINQESDMILKVKNNDTVYKIQNRSYFRLNIYKRINFTKITRFNSEDEAKEFKGVMENISAAGVKLITNCALVINDYLNLDFSFAQFSFDTIIARVIRVKKNKTPNGVVHYEAGLEFVWEELSNQDELANWLNQQTYKCL